MVLQSGERKKSSSLCNRSIVLFPGATFCGSTFRMPRGGWFRACQKSHEHVLYVLPRRYLNLIFIEFFLLGINSTGAAYIRLDINDFFSRIFATSVQRYRLENIRDDNVTLVTRYVTIVYTLSSYINIYKMLIHNVYVFKYIYYARMSMFYKRTPIRKFSFSIFMENNLLYILSNS